MTEVAKRRCGVAAGGPDAHAAFASAALAALGEHAARGAYAALAMFAALIALIALPVPAAAAPAPLPAAAELDVPFVVSPPAVTRAMLEIAIVGPTDRLIDLGSGDGRIVITAARLYRTRGLGVEIDPSLVERSRKNAAKAGVAKLVQFRVQDLFKTDLGRASVITMYLMPDVNLALRPKLLKLKPGTRVVSHDWDMGDWPADRVLEVDAPDKPIGREKKSRVMLWVVPADFSGLWCSRDGATRLRVEQRYQRLTLRGGADANAASFEATAVGAAAEHKEGERVWRLALAPAGVLKLEIAGTGKPWVHRLRRGAANCRG